MISWRPYRAADRKRLRERHCAWCASSGVAFPFPDLDDPRYLITQVAVRNGEVVGAVTAHATVELMFLGADADVARSAVRERARMAEVLRAAGADEAHAFVPNALLDGMEPLLRRFGFQRSNQDYTVFYTKL
ncbi:MAG: hypothetical protein ACRD1C_03780 [Terriglobales bacterium]